MAEAKRDRSKRAQLQRMMGDIGTVLPRQGHGSIELPAAGWYAQMANGKMVYLGDYICLAAAKIRKLHEA